VFVREGADNINMYELQIGRGIDQHRQRPREETKLWLQTKLGYGALWFSLGGDAIVCLLLACYCSTVVSLRAPASEGGGRNGKANGCVSKTTIYGSSERWWLFWRLAKTRCGPPDALQLCLHSHWAMSASLWNRKYINVLSNHVSVL